METPEQKLNRLLSPSNQEQKFDGDTSKKIDDLIHEFYWNEGYTVSHLDHQERILAEVNGIEKAIFNAPYVYKIRGWSGNTGRMNAILTNCFFNLYWKLIQKNVAIDRYYTLQFIFNFFFHVEYSEDGKKIKMPNEDFTALQRIVNYLIETSNKAGNEKILTTQWWDKFKQIVEEKQLLLTNKTFYKESNSKEKWEYITSYTLENKTNNTKQKEYLRYGYKKDNGVITQIVYSPWEYTPCYVSYQIKMNLDNLENKLNFISTFFTRPLTCRNEAITCKGKEIVSSTTQTSKGGRRRQIRRTRKVRSKIEKRNTRRHSK